MTRNVAVCIPTRGDIDIGPIVEPFTHLDQVVVYTSGSVYGRYAAIAQTKAPVILTVDDDNVLPPATVQALLDCYEPGKVVCNVPAAFRDRYTDSALVGFGAIFDRDLPFKAFDTFKKRAGEQNGLFDRECDLVFTMLTPFVMVDLPYTALGYAHGMDRLWRQPGHFETRDRMRELCRTITA